jgi:hypothetical protein
VNDGAAHHDDARLQDLVSVFRIAARGLNEKIHKFV